MIVAATILPYRETGGDESTVKINVLFRYLSDNLYSNWYAKIQILYVSK